jgi:tripartite-type tricarboxylate transporter receptor subunit TctC
VPRGKAWTVDEELKLKALLEAGLPVPIIATRLSKTEVAVVLKVSRLGLKDDKKGEKLLSSSSSGELELPVELPTVEEAGKILGGALLAMMRPGVSKEDLRRWKAVADVAWKYKEFMADFLDYRALEEKYVELRKKYEDLGAQKNGVSARRLG